MSRKYTDVMIDFETLDTVPHAVVLQLGWAFFDAESPPNAEVYSTGQVLFSMPHQVAQRRSLDPETWAWWLTQNPDLFRKLLLGTNTIPQALKVFDKAWDTHAQSKTNIWGNGANFDEPILSNLYRTNRMKMPGHYSASRCVRTIKALHPSVPKVEPEIKHDGESDAIAQALFVQKCYQQRASYIKDLATEKQEAEAMVKETAEDILKRDG